MRRTCNLGGHSSPRSPRNPRRRGRVGVVSRSTPVRALLYYNSITNGLTPTRSEARVSAALSVCAGIKGAGRCSRGATRLRAPVRQHDTSAEPLRWRWRSGCTPLAVTAPASSDAPLLRSTKQPRQICLGTAHVCTRHCWCLASSWPRARRRCRAGDSAGSARHDVLVTDARPC